LTDFRAADQLGKDGANVRHQREGRRAFALGRYDQAVLHFTRVLELEGKTAPVLFERGLAFLRQEQVDLALTDFRAADQLGKDGRVKACLGYCYTWPGRVQ